MDTKLLRIPHPTFEYSLFTFAFDVSNELVSSLSDESASAVTFAGGTAASSPVISK
jgi:hypothetical protein